ncbi:transposase [Poseidonocella sp. HB161398]|uniref:transposase n=1 Tax=Poseidonocella sp. HB161398 TaxID=2320855 RepID=UPI001981D864
MSIPGIGAITATAFATAIEDPGNFRTSRSVDAWLGLTTRWFQSGEVVYDGHISPRRPASEKFALRGSSHHLDTRVLRQ